MGAVVKKDLPTLETLPGTVMDLIVDNLHPKDFANFRAVSRTSYQISRHYISDKPTVAFTLPKMISSRIDYPIVWKEKTYYLTTDGRIVVPGVDFYNRTVEKEAYKLEEGLKAFLTHLSIKRYKVVRLCFSPNRIEKEYLDRCIQVFANFAKRGKTLKCNTLSVEVADSDLVQLLGNIFQAIEYKFENATSAFLEKPIELTRNLREAHFFIWIENMAVKYSEFAANHFTCYKLEIEKKQLEDLVKNKMVHGSGKIQNLVVKDGEVLMDFDAIKNIVKEVNIGRTPHNFIHWDCTTSPSRSNQQHITLWWHSTIKRDRCRLVCHVAKMNYF